MKLLILDAAAADDERTTRAADALAEAATVRGCDVERILIRELDIHACTGCFRCWVKTPGQCVIDDDARMIAERSINSDAVAVVTPLSFGCYGSLAKGALDRQICWIQPHFQMVDGEIHHKLRYAKYPKWLALGTLSRPSAEEAEIFTRLVERNAKNIHDPGHAAEVVAGDESPAVAVEKLLDAAGVRTEVLA